MAVLPELNLEQMIFFRILPGEEAERKVQPPEKRLIYRKSSADFIKEKQMELHLQ
jgi:hypothetical protein